MYGRLPFSVFLRSRRDTNVEVFVGVGHAFVTDKDGYLTGKDLRERPVD